MILKAQSKKIVARFFEYVIIGCNALKILFLSVAHFEKLKQRL